MERISTRGIIRVNDNIFGSIVSDAISQTEGKAFAASDKGKLLTAIGGGRPTAGEIADHIIIKEIEGKIYLDCYIIMLFGASIKVTTEKIFNILERRLKELFPAQAGKIKLKIVGVKSKQIAERNLEVEREWI